MGQLPDGSKVNLSFTLDKDLIVKTPVFRVLKGLKIALNMISDCLELYVNKIINKEQIVYKNFSTTLESCRKFINRKTDVDWDKYVTFLNDQIRLTEANMMRNGSIEILWCLYRATLEFLKAIKNSWLFSKNSLLNVNDGITAFYNSLNSLEVLSNKKITILPYNSKQFGRAIKLEIIYDPIIYIEGNINQEIYDLCDKDDLTNQEVEYLLSYAVDELNIELLQSHSEDKTYTLLLYRLNPYAYKPLKGDWNYIVEGINSSVLLKEKLKSVISGKG